MLSLTVELSAEDLAILRDYATAHPETGGLAGSLHVAITILEQSERRRMEHQADARWPSVPAGESPGSNAAS